MLVPFLLSTTLAISPFEMASMAQADQQAPGAAVGADDSTAVTGVEVRIPAKPKWKNAWVDENRCSTHYETGSRIRTITTCDTQESVDQAWRAQFAIQQQRHATSNNLAKGGSGPKMGSDSQ